MTKSIRTGLVMTLALLLPLTYLWSQSQYNQGYFIDNQGNKTDCLIKNLKWDTNPAEFEYKLNEDAQANKIDISSASVVEIVGQLRFERHTVSIELSSNLNSALDTGPKPNYEDRTLFLRVLVAGPASLYLHNATGKNQFYYSKEDGDPIHLFYKRYWDSSGIIQEINFYRQTLWEALKCREIQEKDINNISYNQPSLVNLIEKYNRCINPLFSNELKQKDPLRFALSFRPGLNSSSVYYSPVSDSFDQNIALRLGLQLEVYLPFQRNKWSLLLEPTYRTYAGEVESSFFRSYSIEYNSIEFALGSRHNMFLNPDAKIFIGAYLFYDAVLNGTITPTGSLESDVVIDIEPSLNMGFGIGFGFKEKWTAEFRYDLDRQLLNDEEFDATFKNISLIIGYNFL